MKRTHSLNSLLAALVLLAAPGLQAATYVQNVLDAGPAAYWRFETVNDTSLSNGFVNTFQGNATVTAAGEGVPLSGVAGNRALLLDGDADSVRTGVTNQLTFASNGTFMAWVNLSQLPSTENRTFELIAKSHFESQLEWLLESNNRLNGFAGGYPQAYYDFNPALATNTWYHLTFTFDSAAGFKRLYVNGVLVGDLPVNPSLSGSEAPIVIGNSSVYTERSVNGRMDEVALFNRALTGAEIQTIFASAGVTTPVPQPVVRLTIDFPREINALERGLNEYYGLGLNFTMIPAPYNSTNALFSTHSNHSIWIGGQWGGAFNSSGWIYNTLGEAVQEATNGLWTLVLNQGATNEQVYRFRVSVTNLSTNDFAIVNMTSPVDGSVGNLPDVPFTWTQSQPWLLNNLELDGPTYSRATVPPGSTSWTNPPTLNLGKHDFNLYLRTNAASWITLTTPTNAASQTLANWDAGAQITSRRGIRFRVGYFTPPPPGLQAHLRFDDENWLGFDSSGNDNHAGASWYGEPPTYAASGVLDGAASFTYGGWLEFTDAFTPAVGGDFTVAVWVQTTQTAGNDTDQGIDGAGIVGGYVGSWSATNTIPIALNGSKAGFMTGNQDGEQTLHSTADINTGGPGWVHVAVTRVQATGQKRIYINGVLDASETGNTNLLDGTERVRVGYGNSITYNGLLDDLQIYSAPLSASDIAYLFANPGATVTNFGGSSGGHRNVAHYAFDDNGNLGLDSSGNGNDAPGVSTWGPVHQFATDAEAGGGAVQFFGTSDLHPDGQALTNLNAVLAGSFTFSAWVKTTVTNGTDDNNAFYGAVIFWAYNDQGNTNDTIPLAITGSKAAFTTRDHLGNFNTLHSLSSVNDGNYHLITVTRNQISGEKRIYVDGNFETSEIGTTDPLNGNNYNLTLGGYAYCTDGDCTNFYAYNGLLDDVQIYTGVLSDAEVASLYANPGTTVPDVTGGNTNGLVVHHDFDEGTVLAADVSGNNNHIVHAGNFGGSGPAISSDTAAGSGSVSFDGGSYLTASPALLSTLAGEFSVSVWLKTSQSFGSQGDLAWQGAGVIAADSPNAGAKDLIPVALTGGQVAFNVGDGSSDDTLNSSTTVNDDAWHHVVVTRSLSTGDRQIFIDGALDSSKGGPAVLLNTPVLLTIGAKSDASIPDPASPDSNGSNGYEGLLDDLQMYNRVLSSQEVAFLHQHPGAVVGGSDLATALNATNLTWVTGGDASWFVQTTNTHDSVSAAQSGAIGDNEESWIETTVTGPGTLSFWWNVSSQAGGDYLEFVMNGNWQTDLTGDSGWDQQTYLIDPGSHTLRWRYYKDDSGSDGLDAAFLDEVSYVPTTYTAPVITINPFNQTNHPGYQVALLAAATSNVAITWEWYKVGIATPIPNATNALYIPSNSGAAGVAGSYFAIASNGFGSATTTVATVTFQNAALPPDWSRAFRTSFTNDPAHTTTDINLASLFDSSGNIYTVGSLNGTNVFGSNILISANGKEGSSFLKQTATGTPIWGRCMTNNGNGGSFPRGIAAAPGDGFYAVGLFFGTNWLGTNQLVDTAGASTYLARFDANGNNLWLRTIVGTNAGFPTHHALVSDPAGNVTLSALVQGHTSFGTTNLFAEGQRGVLAQYDSSGNVRWIQMPSAWPDGLTYSAGRIYGCMGGGSTNHIGGVTNVSDRRRALFSINATNGQGIWIQPFAAYKDQGSPNGLGDNNASVAVSGTNVFVVGTAYGTNVVFGSYSLDYPETTGQYFARYDTNGNAQLATAFGSRYVWPWAALADAAGNVYVGADFDTYAILGSNIIAAPFYETVQFAGNIENRLPGQAFVAKFDRNGNALWARPAESQFSYLNLRDITLAPDGVWACGFFNQVGKFGTNTIYGGLPPYHRSGYLAKITDGAAVALPVTLINPGSSGGAFQFQFLSQAGFTHFVESRTNVAAGIWAPRTNISGDGSLKTMSLPAANAPEFFRVRTQ